MSPDFEDFSLAAGDMQTLLKKSGIQPPSILAGHAMGALYARDYQRRYPGDIAGLILVDPMPEEDVQVKMFGNAVALIDMANHDLLAWPVLPFAPSQTSPPPQRPSPERGMAPPFGRLPAHLQHAREWALKRLFEKLDNLSAGQSHQIMESERTAFFDLYNARHTTILGLPVVVLSRGEDVNPSIRQMQISWRESPAARSVKRRNPAECKFKLNNRTWYPPRWRICCSHCAARAADALPFPPELEHAIAGLTPQFCSRARGKNEPFPEVKILLPRTPSQSVPAKASP